MKTINEKEKELNDLENEIIEWNRESTGISNRLFKIADSTQYDYSTVFFSAVCYTLRQNGFYIADFEEFQDEFADRYSYLMREAGDADLEELVLSFDDIKYIYLISEFSSEDVNESKMLDFLKRAYGKTLKERREEIILAETVTNAVAAKKKINIMPKDVIIRCFAESLQNVYDDKVKELASVNKEFSSLETAYSGTNFDYTKDARYAQLVDKRNEINSALQNLREERVLLEADLSTLSLEELRSRFASKTTDPNLNYAEEVETYLSRKKLDDLGLHDMYSDNPLSLQSQYFSIYEYDQIDTFYKSVEAYEAARDSELELSKLAVTDEVVELSDQMESELNLIKTLQGNVERWQEEKNELETGRVYKNRSEMSRTYLMDSIVAGKSLRMKLIGDDEEEEMRIADKKFQKKYGITHQEFMDSIDSTRNTINGIFNAIRGANDTISYKRNLFRMNTVLLVTAVRKVFPEFDLSKAFPYIPKEDCPELISLADFLIKDENHPDEDISIVNKALDQASANTSNSLQQVKIEYDLLPVELKSDDIDFDNDEETSAVLQAKKYVTDILNAVELARRPITLPTDVLELVASDYDSLYKQDSKESAAKVFAKKIENKE